MNESFPTPDRRYKVVIVCLTYNQEQYIEDALRGFAGQRTDFDYCAVVVDDNSSDRTADIIRRYEAQYPDRIRGIYLPENYYSQNKSKVPLLRPWHQHSDYLALCEGDDYWTDPDKLQKQVDWLDRHPACTMCCTDSEVRRHDGTVEDWHHYPADCDIPVQDLILGSGLWLQTPTLVFRSRLYDDFPDYCWRCHVADYPLQIWAALQGDVHYLHQKTSVYRLFTTGSWMSGIQRRYAAYMLISGWETELQMLQGLDRYSEGRYHDTFLQREAHYIWINLIKYRLCTRTLQLDEELRARFSQRQRLVIWLLRSPVIAALCWLPGVPWLIDRIRLLKYRLHHNG